ADLLLYGMGERGVVELARSVEHTGTLPVDLPGAVVFAQSVPPTGEHLVLPSFGEVKADGRAFNSALTTIWQHANPHRGKRLFQDQGGRTICINPPAAPLTAVELDAIYDLPYTRRAHPSHLAPVPALETVRWSVVTHRGCYGGCRFCSIYFHQGPEIQSRSIRSLAGEVQRFAADPLFRGTVSDLGGPSANMYGTHCRVEGRKKGCTRESCLSPQVCPSLMTDQTQTLELWDAVMALPKVKHCFVASGVRYDLALLHEKYLSRLIRERTGGHLKVAPEHISDAVTSAMMKPGKEVFVRFLKRFASLKKPGQYLVPYMISSHPECDQRHMQELRSFMEKEGLKLEQAQDFIPLPMTFSGAMFHTGLHPFTGESVFVEKSKQGKLKQREVLSPAGAPSLRGNSLKRPRTSRKRRT
ncbi:radical SAM protein, partial [Myxococcota bacterium]|nr:radical SAM protein [Myxococcota bacterium]MBU1536262.1 radical SAM protein [Myxococcota bacterium]